MPVDARPEMSKVPPAVLMKRACPPVLEPKKRTRVPVVMVAVPAEEVSSKSRKLVFIVALPALLALEKDTLEPDRVALPALLLSKKWVKLANPLTMVAEPAVLESLNIVLPPLEPPPPVLLMDAE